jgi:hypothetical protein
MDSGLNHAHEFRETVQAVEVQAGAAGLGEQSSAESFAGRPEAETEQNSLQRSEELVVVIIRPLPVPDHILRSQTQIVLKNTFKQIQRMKWMTILFDEVDLF